MANFKTAYLNTKKWEGGYTDNPDDNGNWTGGKKGVGKLIGTNKGISAPLLKQFLKKEPTVLDMKNIADSTVEALYLKEFWVKIRGYEINNQELANTLYDTAVNMGVSRAVKLMQQTLELPETGIVDDKFINKINNK